MAVARRTWLIGGVAVAAVLVAVGVAVARGGDEATTGTARTTPTTVGQGGGAPPGVSTTTGATAAGPSTTPPVSPTGPSYGCPPEDRRAAEELQRAVDEGHQPWRLSPEDVAAVCAGVGLGQADVEAVGPTTYRVTNRATGDVFIVEVTQPVRQSPNGIWVATSITPAG